MPKPDQPGRELGDMYVLAARIDPANGSQRARVFRNQGYAHRRSRPLGIGAQQVPGSSAPKPGAVRTRQVAMEA
jgi:hypothetical protein